jgi:hypothetical protein
MLNPSIFLPQSPRVANDVITYVPRLNLAITDMYKSIAREMALLVPWGNIDGGHPDDIYAPNQKIDCGGPV